MSPGLSTGLAILIGDESTVRLWRAQAILETVKCPVEVFKRVDTVRELVYFRTGAEVLEPGSFTDTHILKV